ncbi:hypothetical protein [Marivirga sp.]|uniref:hypothetical protein n=1 Tax=Marivirga sp. TaxID=2018662 RepID=UPI0025D967F9|nr:hypothetical protein [Marivirga sp.]
MKFRKTILLACLILTLMSFGKLFDANACTVSQSCGEGQGSVGCSGESSCSSSYYDMSVTCDGVTSMCPAPLARPPKSLY